MAVYWQDRRACSHNSYSLPSEYRRQRYKRCGLHPPNNAPTPNLQQSHPSFFSFNNKNDVYLDKT
uniref:Uncharacterized protein n=1 Tax=Ascaris lumbricoides TaxID=6252 RepID=A0A0M3IX85_ASCLU